MAIDMGIETGYTEDMSNDRTHSQILEEWYKQERQARAGVFGYDSADTGMKTNEGWNYRAERD